MGRNHRIDHVDGYHHVTSRGTDQWNIFLDDVDRRFFLRILARACRNHGVEVVAFCLMGNHFHLLLYCPNGKLSDALHDLKGNYARSFNRRHARSGPVFGERFFSEPIHEDGYLVAAIRYIHRNPLDLDARTSLAAYRWSSHSMYLGLASIPAWLGMKVALSLFGPAYREVVERPLPSDKVQNIYRPEPSSVAAPIAAVPGTAAIQPAALSVAAIAQEVAQAADCEVGDVRQRAHNGLVGLVAVLSVDLAGQTAAEIAEPLGYKSPSSVRSALTRTRRRIQNDLEFALIHCCVTQRLQGAG